MRAIIDDLKRGVVDDALRRLADTVSTAFDFRDMCSDIKPEEMAQYLYDHLNKDG